jgi:hypothetical protein
VAASNTPATAPAPAAAGSGPGAGNREPGSGAPPGDWSAVLSALEARRKFSLLGYYQHARILKWTPDAIEIGFATDWHGLGEMASEKDKLDEMTKFLAEHLGRPVTIKLKMLDAKESASGAVKSVIEATRDRETEERKKRESEAREHPVTKLVLETFGASIKEIKTDV